MAEEIKTTLGTPCAPGWPMEWIHQVEQAEAELGHRICGGIAPDGTPCQLTSEHRSGRCKYHGGSPFTGAQLGNKNAMKHGLYSRRLLTCGPHCSRWKSCPYAEEQLVDLPKTQWPTCPYEQEEYDNLAETLVPKDGDHSAQIEHLAHSTALLSVMTTRAAAMLSMYTLVDVTTGQGRNYTMISKKISVPLAAFLRLSNEHLKYARELAKLSGAAAKRDAKAKAEEKPMNLPDKMKPLLMANMDILEAAYQEGVDEYERLKEEGKLERPSEGSSANDWADYNMQEAFKDKDNPPKLSRHGSMNEWADFDLEKHKAQGKQNEEGEQNEEENEEWETSSLRKEEVSQTLPEETGLSCDGMAGSADSKTRGCCPLPAPEEAGVPSEGGFTTHTTATSEPHSPTNAPDNQQNEEDQRETASPHAPHSPADKPGILDMKSLLMQNTDILQDCLEDTEEEQKEQGKEVQEE